MPPDAQDLDDRRHAAISPVDAHILLNSASTVLLGLSTLKDGWDSMSDEDRTDVLDLVHHRTLAFVEELQELIRLDL